MKKYLLDTNICIFFSKGQYDLDKKINEVGQRTQDQIIDDFDLLIGATAIANNLIMVTNNTAHFKRLSDIIIEDWTKIAEKQ